MRSIYLHEGELQILITVNRFRFIPLKVLSGVLTDLGIYSSYDTVARAVRRMVSRKYLRETVVYNNAKVIFLSRKGAEVLEASVDLAGNRANCPTRLTGVNYIALEHTIRVSELYILFSKEAKIHEIELLDFHGDRSLRFDYSFRDSGSGKKISKAIIPDARIRLRKGETQKLYFIEYDRGTESHLAVAEKYQKYFEWFVYGDWELRLGQFPTILFICERPTKKRIKNLLPEEDFNRDSSSKWSNVRPHKNVVLRGVTDSGNIKNIASSKIQEYLNGQFCQFVDYPSLKRDGFRVDIFDHLYKVLPAALIEWVDKND